MPTLLRELHRLCQLLIEGIPLPTVVCLSIPVRTQDRIPGACKRTLPVVIAVARPDSPSNDTGTTTHNVITVSRVGVLVPDLTLPGSTVARVEIDLVPPNITGIKNGTRSRVDVLPYSSKTPFLPNNAMASRLWKTGYTSQKGIIQGTCLMLDQWSKGSGLPPPIDRKWPGVGPYP